MAQAAGSTDQMEDELGDLLFTIVNLARWGESGSGAGFAARECEVPAAVRTCGAAGGGARARIWAHAQSNGWEALLAGSEEIVDLVREEQFSEAVQLQRTIWGFSDIDLCRCGFLWWRRRLAGRFSARTDGTRMVAFWSGDSWIEGGWVGLFA